jgi:CelD/BcsL family acetyltransferase involved in cellulose biosynthesis
LSIAKSQESSPVEAGAGLRARLGAQFDALSRVAIGGGRIYQRDNIEVRWAPIAHFRADHSAWRELTRTTLEPNVFLEPAFAFPAAGQIGPKDLGILTVHAGQQLVGLLPGRVEGIASGRPVPVFVSWTHPFAPLSLPLVDRQASAEAVPAMMSALRVLPGAPKAALFPLLPEQSVTARLIALQAAAAGHSITRFNIHSRAALMREEDEALSMVSTRKTKELRRQRRRLAELGNLVHQVATSPGDVRRSVAQFIAIEELGWKGRSGGAVAHDARAAGFLSEAVVSLASEGKARIDRLTLNDRTIAAAITLRSGDYAWFWKIAYDEEFSRFSPGVQLTLDLTEGLEADQRLSLVDSCAVADHPMIDHLWAGRIPMADWLVPLDGAGSFAIAAFGERARRATLRPLKALRRRFRR